MIRKSQLSGVTYALIPLRKDEYNCVKASREVLRAGGIDFLNDVITPFGVSYKIRGDPSYKEIDTYVAVHGILPRASSAIVQAAGLDLNDGSFGWILGGVLVLLGAYMLSTNTTEATVLKILQQRKKQLYMSSTCNLINCYIVL